MAQGSVGMMMPASFMPDEKIFLGIHLELNKGGEHIVWKVDAGSPAMQGGVKVGTVLLAMNGAPLRGMSDAEVRDISRQFPGSKLILKILLPGTRGSSEAIDRVLFFHRNQAKGPANFFDWIGKEPAREESGDDVLSPTSLARFVNGSPRISPQKHAGSIRRDVQHRARSADLVVAGLTTRAVESHPRSPSMFATTYVPNSLVHKPRGGETDNDGKQLRGREEQNGSGRSRQWGIGCVLAHHQDGTIIVEHVKVGGGADDASIQAGWRLTAVDGRPVHDVPIKVIRGWCLGPAGTSTTVELLTAERESQVRQVWRKSLLDDGSQKAPGEGAPPSLCINDKVVATRTLADPRHFHDRKFGASVSRPQSAHMISVLLEHSTRTRRSAEHILDVADAASAHWRAGMCMHALNGSAADGSAPICASCRDLLSSHGVRVGGAGEVRDFGSLGCHRGSAKVGGASSELVSGGDSGKHENGCR